MPRTVQELNKYLLKKKYTLEKERQGEKKLENARLEVELRLCH